MPETTRRDIVKGAAWSVPIIALAVAAPASAASTPAEPKLPYSCEHIGDKKNTLWQGTYTNGEIIHMTHSEAMSSKVWGKLCRASGNGPGAGN